MSYKAIAHIHSLNGEMAEITVLEKVGDRLGKPHTDDWFSLPRSRKLLC